MFYFPIFSGLTHFANPELEQALKKAPVTVIADPTTCQFLFDPTGAKKFTSSCDIVRTVLTKASVAYVTETGPIGLIAMIKIGDKIISGYEARGLLPEEASAKEKTFKGIVEAALKEAGYPAAANPEKINKPMVLILLVLLVIFVTMVYAPIAAMLVEMFPTRIRYTSMSLPYHIGNGWFGGLLPTIVFALVA